MTPAGWFRGDRARWLHGDRIGSRGVYCARCDLLGTEPHDHLVGPDAVARLVRGLAGRADPDRPRFVENVIVTALDPMLDLATPTGRTKTLALLRAEARRHRNEEQRREHLRGLTLRVTDALVRLELGARRHAVTDADVQRAILDGIAQWRDR